jgi:hypothetical protein
VRCSILIIARPAFTPVLFNLLQGRVKVIVMKICILAHRLRPRLSPALTLDGVDSNIHFPCYLSLRFLPPFADGLISVGLSQENLDNAGDLIGLRVATVPPHRQMIVNQIRKIPYFISHI